MGLIKKPKEMWLKPVPPNVTFQQVKLNFKLDPSDVGKAGVVVVDADMFVTSIAANSLWNGLIGGDRLVKVNDKEITNKTVKECLQEISKGECVIELIRRKGMLPVLKKIKDEPRRGHAIFYLEVERPRNMSSTAVGLKLILAKRRAFVLNVDTNTIGYPFFGRGDAIIDFDGVPVPEQGDSDAFVREHLSKVSTGKKMTFLVERAVCPSVTREWMKFIDLFTFEDDDYEFANDVLEIGREASNMHYLVFRKLHTPSILASDVRKQKRANNKTSDATESSVHISTASTEVKVKSDVSDNEDLKPVVKKSHAVHGDGDDEGVEFD